jgi:hypothetical protein
VEIQGVDMLAQIVGVCCVAFISPVGVVDGVWREQERERERERRVLYL